MKCKQYSPGFEPRWSSRFATTITTTPKTHSSHTRVCVCVCLCVCLYDHIYLSIYLSIQQQLWYFLYHFYSNVQLFTYSTIWTENSINDFPLCFPHLCGHFNKTTKDTPTHTHVCNKNDFVMIISWLDGTINARAIKIGNIFLFFLFLFFFFC